MTTPDCHYSFIYLYSHVYLRYLPSFPTRRSSDLSCPPRCRTWWRTRERHARCRPNHGSPPPWRTARTPGSACPRSEEHTSELQSRGHLVCRLLLEKKKHKIDYAAQHINSRRSISE